MISEAGISPAHPKSKVETNSIKTGDKKVEAKDLITELRHKYITILKSIYWEHFEDGQMQPGSVTTLIESADRALDHEEDDMADWDFIKSYLASDTYLKITSFLARIPIIGGYYRQKIFMHHSLAYDIIVNFVDAHE